MIEVEQARKCLRGKCNFMRQACEGEQKVFMELEKAYSWLPLSSWGAVFPAGVAPADLGLHTETIHDEAGSAEEGVVFDTGSPFKTLKVKIQVGSSLSTKVLEPAKQLRPAQGVDTMRWANKELLQKEWPKALHSHSCPSIDAMKQQAKDLVEQRNKAPPPPPPPQPQQQPAEAEATPAVAGEPQQQDLDAVDSDNELCDPAVLLQSHAATTPGKGKSKKGDKKERGKPEQKKPAAKRQQTNVASVSRSSLAGQKQEGRQSCGGSVCSGADRAARSRSPARSVAPSAAVSAVGSTAQKEKIKLERQHGKYMSLLDLTSIVNGKAVGNEINNSKRIIDAMDLREQGSAEVVELRAKVRLAELARSLNVQNLPQLSKQARLDGLKEVWDHLSEIPEDWATAVFCAALKDTLAVASTELSTVEGRQKLLEMLSPEGDPGAKLEIGHTQHNIQTLHVFIGNVRACDKLMSLSFSSIPA